VICGGLTNSTIDGDIGGGLTNSTIDGDIGDVLNSMYLNKSNAVGSIDGATMNGDSAIGRGGGGASMGGGSLTAVNGTVTMGDATFAVGGDSTSGSTDDLTMVVGGSIIGGGVRCESTFVADGDSNTG
jgi:hypothetical protein